MAQVPEHRARLFPPPCRVSLLLATPATSAGTCLLSPPSRLTFLVTLDSFPGRIRPHARGLAFGFLPEWKQKPKRELCTGSSRLCALRISGFLPGIGASFSALLHSLALSPAVGFFGLLWRFPKRAEQASASGAPFPVPGSLSAQELVLLLWLSCF